jgi:hypothetical protein
MKDVVSSLPIHATSRNLFAVSEPVRKSIGSIMEVREEDSRDGSRSMSVNMAIAPKLGKGNAEKNDPENGGKPYTPKDGGVRDDLSIIQEMLMKER